MFFRLSRRVRAICQIVLLVVVIQFVDSIQAQDEHSLITVANSSQVVQIERLGSGAVRQIVFAPDGSHVALATTLSVWVINAQWGSPDSRHSQLLEGQGGAFSVAFSPNASLIAGGGDDGSVMVWDVANGNIVARLENHIYGVKAVAWSPDGALLASGDESGVIRLWDTVNWREDRVFALPDAVRVLEFDPSGASLNGETSFEPVVVHLNTGEIQEFSGILSNYLYPSFAVLRSKQAWVDGGTVHITQSGREIYQEYGFHDSLDGVYFRSNGQVAAHETDSEWYWVGEDGIAMPDLDEPVISPDGMHEARYGNDGVIRLIDTSTGDEIAALYGHIRAVTAVAFSPDGLLLASSSNDGTIRLWDAAVTEDSGSLVTLTGHNGGVSGVAFNADGTLLGSSGYDGTVRLWAVG